MSRIIFAGTPDFAAVHLQALLDAGVRPVAVYTQPDRPAGRGHKLTPSPVKSLALAHGLEIRTPLNFKNQAEIEEFSSFNADLAIVVAYGLLLPEAVFAAPRLGSINVHASLLPRWRGAAPIQRAILAGDQETGVTVMRIAAGLDTGDMLVKARVPIEPDDTAGTLFDKLAALGAQTLIQSLPAILAGTLPAARQDDSKALYAKKISKDESPLDFMKSARELSLQVRGLNPWPAAQLKLGDNLCKIFGAQALDTDSGTPGTLRFDKRGILLACAQGTLLITALQAPGKKPCDAAAFARSHQDLFS